MADTGTKPRATTVLKTAKPVQTRYLLVWFTRVPEQDSGERRVLVSEIDIR